jgi:hypothetical protein
MIQINLGSITKTIKGLKQHQVYFTNPINNKANYLGVFISKEEANDFLDSYLLDFYYENPFLLPKGIFACKSNNHFGYTISIKGKNKRVINSKSLKEVVDCRIEFINTLLF